MTIVSEIKLIRTDTTLDLSQKAEKVCLVIGLDSLMLPDAQRALWGSIPNPRGAAKWQKHSTPAIPTWSPTAVLSRPNGA